MKLRQLAFTLLILLVISDFSLSSDYKKKRVKNSSSKKFLAYFLKALGMRSIVRLTMFNQRFRRPDDCIELKLVLKLPRRIRKLGKGLKKINKLKSNAGPKRRRFFKRIARVHSVTLFRNVFTGLSNCRYVPRLTRYYLKKASKVFKKIIWGRCTSKKSKKRCRIFSHMRVRRVFGRIRALLKLSRKRRFRHSYKKSSKNVKKSKRNTSKRHRKGGKSGKTRKYKKKTSRKSGLTGRRAFYYIAKTFARLLKRFIRSLGRKHYKRWKRSIKRASRRLRRSIRRAKRRLNRKSSRRLRKSNSKTSRRLKKSLKKKLKYEKREYKKLDDFDRKDKVDKRDKAEKVEKIDNIEKRINEKIEKIEKKLNEPPNKNAISLLEKKATTPVTPSTLNKNNLIPKIQPQSPTIAKISNIIN